MSESKKVCVRVFCAMIICLILAILAVFLPIFYAFNLPAQYEETYVAAMSDKVHALKSMRGERVVLVGGSNLPFGVDSGLLEEKLERPVINMGLYAALGGKIMLDLTIDNIKSGDLVIFAYEYSSQMYSMYTNTETTLQMLDADMELMQYLNKSDLLPMIGGIPQLIEQKKKFIQSNTTPAPAPPYTRTAFNLLGDIETQRPYNEMALMYDPSMKINMDTSLINDEFIRYFNSYAKKIKKKNAEVVISFPPVNRLAMDKTCGEEQILEFYDFVRSEFDAEVISFPSDYIIHEDYFYDSNYHLNDSGATLRTDLLLGDIKRHIGDISANGIAIPEGSGARPIEEEPDGGEQLPWDDFIYTIEDGRVTVTGVSADGKAKSKLVIPSKIEGYSVFQLADRAFADCPSLTEVDIPATVTVLGGSLFENAPQLTKVNLNLSFDILKPLPQVGDKLLNGANDALIIYVASSRYGQITSDYFWSRYAQRIAVK